MMTRFAGFKYAALCCCFLALAACSKKQPDLDAGLNGNGGAGVGQAVPGSKADFTTNVGDRVFFLQDQSTLTPEASDTLTKQANWLKQYAQVTVQVEGHADERGTREYNIALSARRATAARNFLIQQGVPGNRISSIAYGKERPVALCDAEQCWSQNRRAVTVITGGTQ
ncbi:MAG: peptidoglycan-associated lipoprotein Pal [Alphaproteobacteria bacterium]|nr:peptidoglycan-associated lipoprotein Pal [Alphaproteobacteria bacterium]